MNEKDIAVALKVNNVLLLAQALGLDATKPLDAQKVLRHLVVVEQAVKSDERE